jgi:Holliday junction resolvase RusA-like endonuclease
MTESPELLQNVNPLMQGGIDWLELRLPRPPSVNRFTAKLGNKSPIVKRWVRQADMALVLARAERRFPQAKLLCEFECEFEFERGTRPSDIDNRVKPLLDWLQRVQLIDNDRHCERLEVRWGPPDSGVLVRLRPWVAA